MFKNVSKASKNTVRLIPPEGLYFHLQFYESRKARYLTEISPFKCERKRPVTALLFLPFFILNRLSFFPAPMIESRRWLACKKLSQSDGISADPSVRFAGGGFSNEDIKSGGVGGNKEGEMPVSRPE